MKKKDFCKSCNNEIDPDYCWCGGHMKHHSLYDNHYPVNMGCDCYRVKTEDWLSDKLIID